MQSYKTLKKGLIMAQLWTNFWFKDKHSHFYPSFIMLCWHSVPTSLLLSLRMVLICMQKMTIVSWRVLSSSSLPSLAINQRSQYSNFLLWVMQNTKWFSVEMFVVWCERKTTACKRRSRQSSKSWDIFKQAIPIWSPKLRHPYFQTHSNSHQNNSYPAHRLFSTI